MHADSELIQRLGGPTKVAELLNFPKQGGVQRVQNWMARGIPAKVKLEHQALFLNPENTEADKNSSQSAA